MIRVQMSGKRADAFALVDDEDGPSVTGQKWWVCGGYAVNNRNRAMHREILGLEPGDRIVHHINEDPLDNRRANLMICATRSEANSQPHPKRDAAFSRGIALYLAHLERRREARA